MLHRDIKPRNIIVGKHGETLVVDWGLAKATGKSDLSAEERHAKHPRLGPVWGRDGTKDTESTGQNDVQCGDKRARNA